MTIDDEAPSLLERYSRAMGSSHLRVSARERGDVDIVIAAGSVGRKPGEKDEAPQPGAIPSTLGGMLYRLLAEYDIARGECAIGERNRHAARNGFKAEIKQRMADHEHRRRRRGETAPLTASEASQVGDEIAKEVRDQSNRDEAMSHALILLKLGSLTEVKQAFLDWAVIQADNARFEPCGPMPTEGVDAAPDGQFFEWRQQQKARLALIASISGHVLGVLLNPTCFQCQGRGFNGGYNGLPQVICRSRDGCGGSGRRNHITGKSADQHAFAGLLFDQAQMKLIAVERRMKWWLKQYGDDGL